MSVRAKRGTTAQINAAAAANGLKIGELIYDTTKNEAEVATSTSARKTIALADLSNVSQSDARTKVGTGTMAYRDVTVSTSNPSGSPANGTVWLKV